MNTESNESHLFLQLQAYWKAVWEDTGATVASAYCGHSLWPRMWSDIQLLLRLHNLSLGHVSAWDPLSVLDWQARHLLPQLLVGPSVLFLPSEGRWERDATAANFRVLTHKG